MPQQDPLYQPVNKALLGDAKDKRNKRAFYMAILVAVFCYGLLIPDFIKMQQGGGGLLGFLAFAVIFIHHGIIFVPRILGQQGLGPTTRLQFEEAVAQGHATDQQDEINPNSIQIRIGKDQKIVGEDLLNAVVKLQNAAEECLKARSRIPQDADEVQQAFKKAQQISQQIIKAAGEIQQSAAGKKS